MVRFCRSPPRLVTWMPRSPRRFVPPRRYAVLPRSALRVLPRLPPSAVCLPFDRSCGSTARLRLRAFTPFCTYAVLPLYAVYA